MRSLKFCRTLLLFFSFILLATCAKEIVDLTGDIKGIVKDADGKLVDNCLVSITPTGAAKITNSGGSFEFNRLDPGEYTITVKKEGYTEKTAKVVVLSGKVVDVDIVLESAYGSIKGTIKDETNALIGNCQISLSPGGASLTTGTNGVFEFTKQTPGEYTLTAKKEGYADKSIKITVNAGKTTDVDIVLAYAYGSIKGTVKDEAGTLVSNCQISLSPGGASLTTGANGVFEFTEQTPGEYTITAKKEGYADKSMKVTVNAGKTTDVDIVLASAYGKIAGSVKDADDNHLIENCLVSLSPGGTSMTTGTNGTFEFNDLSSGEYTLSFKKTGYPDKTEKVSVTTGKVTNVDIVLKMENPITISESELDFSDFGTTKSFMISNNTDGDCSFTISNVPSWITLSMTSGSINKQSSTTIVATADREKISYGLYTQNMIIAYSGRVKGELMLKASIEKVLLTTPEVSIYSSAENVTETSFDIKGNISTTGGSQILDYGHCWSTKENPDINDHCTRLGQRSEAGVFVSTATGLTVATTYYVRAYARNTQGTTYSEQITVTTQSPNSDKWDGKKAKSFARGDGSKIDPFVIETGGQLFLMRDYAGDYFFKLANDIDLDNRNWMPIPTFIGRLDGNGHTISNLHIERDDVSNCGLIGKMTGDDMTSIKNLIIRGVNIKGDYACAGAIVGHMNAGSITNCKVIFDEDSELRGKDCVGGIVGEVAYNYSSSNYHIEECTVETTTSDDRYHILGTNYVGGIVGSGSTSTHTSWNNLYINDCHVLRCNIIGTNYVGGITGLAYYNHINYFSNCEYQGTLDGYRYVGGITGNAGSITASKVVANINCEADNAGGLSGDVAIVVACYVDGTITCSNGNAESLYGMTTSSDITFSYSTMQCDHSVFKPLGNESVYNNYTTYSYSIYDADIDKIKQIYEDSYDDNIDYWNFNKTWTWTGVVNGEQKSVVLPRLAWE